MSELFSNVRLIDYFLMFEIDELEYDNTTNLENMDLIFNNEDNNPVKVLYKYKTLYEIPKKKPYKEYEFQTESLYQMLPSEYIYLTKPPNTFFSLVFTSSDSRYYYGFFFKTYELLDINHPIYDKLKELPQQIYQIYIPKYLSLISLNPYFISFKYLLEEIYTQSQINDNKCYKIENILGTLLYRLYLPKYESTQLQFALGDKMYMFTNNMRNSEFSLKLLFSYLNVERVVSLILAFIMNSIIVFFHSE
jgi:hypothetical protein